MNVEHLSIEGKTPSEIHVTDESLLFVCGNEAFQAYHLQDCCESVYIHDISGDLQSLVGKRVIKATQEAVSNEWPNDVPRPKYEPESFTWTTQVFRAKGVRVVVRWLGKSNGYYNEKVYFQQTHVPISVESF
jgi:hypothetical protein